MNILEEANMVAREMKRCKNALSEFGREIYKARDNDNGYGLSSHDFSGWYTTIAGPDTEWDGNEDYRYPDETPIAILQYYNNRWCSEMNVIIPISYFEHPESAIEQDRRFKEEELRARIEANRIEKEEKAKHDLIMRREMYEKLKEEFGS